MPLYESRRAVGGDVGEILDEAAGKEQMGGATTRLRIMGVPRGTPRQKQQPLHKKEGRGS